MRTGGFYMNLFLSSLIIVVWNGNFDFVDCHRRKPRRYHALRHVGGAAVPFAMSSHKQFIFMTESLRLHREQVCDRQRLHIKCPLHTKIMVETAFYGRRVPSSELCAPRRTSKGAKQKNGGGFSWQDQRFEDTSCEVTNAYTKITERCQNKDECQFQVKPQFFGRDSCPETSKYLQLSFKCRPSQFMSDNYCENSNVELNCRNEGQRLAVYSATYGRTVTSTMAACDKGTVLSDCTVDVLNRIMFTCHAQRSCSFNVSDEFLRISSSPCDSDVQKHLNLVHMCVDETIFSAKSIVGPPNSAESSSIIDQMATTSTMTNDIVSSTTKRLSATSSQSSMNDGRSSSAAAGYPSFVDYATGETIPSSRSNDSVGDPSGLVDSKCSSSSPSSTSTSPYLSTCIPPSLPNAVGFVQYWMATYQYLKDNKEKFILYFCLSSSAGIIVLLVFLIIQMFRRRYQTAGRRRVTHMNGVASKEVDYMSVTSPVVFDNESRMEMSDFGRDGVSFMRFNHPTPPRSGGGGGVNAAPPQFYNS